MHPTTQTTDQKLIALYDKADMMCQFALDAMDLVMFYKYQVLCLYLVGRRINLMKKEIN